MAFSITALKDWINEQPVSFKVPFNAGPELLEFGLADSSGNVASVPGGSGETHEGAFEEKAVMLVWRSRREHYEKLERSAAELDTALRGIENTDGLWGTYVRYVLRQGTIDDSFEEPERVTLIANYTLELGS